jgi:hypothetical protein
MKVRSRQLRTVLLRDATSNTSWKSDASLRRSFFGTRPATVNDSQVTISSHVAIAKMFKIPRIRPLTCQKFRSFIFPPQRVSVTGFAVACVGIGVLLSPRIHLDAPKPAYDPVAAKASVVKDPATDIEFPTTLRIPSRFPLPAYTLLGVGVRKVWPLTVSSHLSSYGNKSCYVSSRRCHFWVLKSIRLGSTLIWIVCPRSARLISYLLLAWRIIS